MQEFDPNDPLALRAKRAKEVMGTVAIEPMPPSAQVKYEYMWTGLELHADQIREMGQKGWQMCGTDYELVENVNDPEGQKWDAMGYVFTRAVVGRATVDELSDKLFDVQKAWGNFADKWVARVADNHFQSDLAHLDALLDELDEML